MFDPTRHMQKIAAVIAHGPCREPEGSFSDVQRTAYTAEDIRFTWKAPCQYATILSWPPDGRVCICSLQQNSKLFNGVIQHITVLGHEQLQYPYGFQPGKPAAAAMLLRRMQGDVSPPRIERLHTS